MNNLMKNELNYSIHIKDVNCSYVKIKSDTVLNHLNAYETYSDINIIFNSDFVFVSLKTDKEIDTSRDLPIILQNIRNAILRKVRNVMEFTLEIIIVSLGGITCKNKELRFLLQNNYTTIESWLTRLK